VPEPSAFDFEVAVEKLKRHKSSGTDQIAAELIKAGGMTIHSEIRKLVLLFRIRMNCLKSGRVIKQIVVIIDAYHFCQLRTKLYPASCCQG